jgi:glycosyltransferase involved in cell wall biosynthesis
VKNTFLISIPTLNSGKTLEKALDSVNNQTYKNFTCNIVDSYSKDDTVEIARNKEVEVKLYRGKLLGARYEGFIRENCDYVVLMDSDQVLEKTLLKRLDALLNERNIDMVILEERSYRTGNWVEKMSDLNRAIVHREYNSNISSESGVLLPRVFKKKLIKRAFSKIDPELYPEVTAHDHAIIYYECSRLSNKIAFVENGIFHQEPTTLKETFRHFADYGKNTKNFEKLGLYADFIHKKISGRKKGLLRNFFSRKLLTLPLLLTKGLGYYYGYWFKR